MINKFSAKISKKQAYPAKKDDFFDFLFKIIKNYLFLHFKIIERVGG